MEMGRVLVEGAVRVSGGYDAGARRRRIQAHGDHQRDDEWRILEESATGNKQQ